MSKLHIRNSTELIEVENVYCIGKNYTEHIKELDRLGHDSDIPVEPVIFLKPNTCVQSIPQSVIIPEYKGHKISKNLQNEVELVVVIGKDGVRIPVEETLSYVYGYAVGIDFTLRDIQSEMKAKGLPWTLSKGFLTAAPVSEIVKKEDVSNPQVLKLCLKINNEIKQQASTSEMIFRVDYIIHYISSIFGIRRGDLIFTGTPAGVTKLNSGDRVYAEIEKIGELNIIVN
jgi:5-carboxymethyl-2-hydroxymuconate isomerase